MKNFLVDRHRTPGSEKTEDATALTGWRVWPTSSRCSILTKAAANQGT
jgi:hypothetical protein